MFEKNRDILKHAISRMPGRKPKASGWTGISQSLDKIDSGGTSFQQGSSLPVHKAPAGAWNKIAASLPLTPMSFLTSLWGLLIIGAIIVGGLITAYLLTADKENEIQPVVVSEDQLMSTTVEEGIVSPSVSNEAETDISSFPSQEMGEMITRETTNNIVNNDPVDAAASSSPGESSPLSTVQSSTPDNSQINDVSQMPARAILHRSELHQPNIISSDRPRDLKRKNFSSSDLTGQINYARDMNTSKLKLGAFYAYKVFQDIEQEEMNIPSALSSFGIDLTYEKNKWFFRTALSYVGWKEKGLYTFDYDQNQMVYQYDYVDSAYVDPVNGSVTYYTTPQEVYDSVPGMLNDQAVYEYKYLQIPVILGYRFLERNKFSLAILGGAGIDIRLSGKQFIPVFDKENASVIETNSNLKYRADQNWRILLGLEATYNLTPGWELFAEPGYQWYLKPVYAPDNIKGAGLLNVKFGLRYIF